MGRIRTVLYPFSATVLVILTVGLRETLPHQTTSDLNGISPAPVATHVQESDRNLFLTIIPDDCLDCHDDDSMTMERNGVVLSLNIPSAAYAVSEHRSLDCLECHVGFDPDEEPHLEQITPVRCDGCHTVERRSLSQSGIHASELRCTDCHRNVHAPEQPEALEESCLMCHDIVPSDLAGTPHSLDLKGPGCLDCHNGHQPLASITDNCTACHSSDTHREEIVGRDTSTIISDFSNSVHGDLIECSDCHTGHHIVPPNDSTSSIAPMNLASTCSTCHDEAGQQFAGSEHDTAVMNGVFPAPACTACHGEHAIYEVSDSLAMVNRQNEVDLCLGCHLDSPEVRELMTHSSAFISSYETSVHGRAEASGNSEAAICSDCHGAHDVLPASDYRSTVNIFRIASTCGSCHNDVADQFARSIHGKALSDGINDAPTCTNCHGEHQILAPSDSESPVATINISSQVCDPCHNSVKLSEKYGFPPDRGSTFGDSYHGLAGEMGSRDVANCTSCHGVHEIRSAADPLSTVNKANLETTCGKCHPGANANFARGSVHVIRTEQGETVLYWISKIYLLLIVCVIGLMALHNFIDWLRKLIDKQKAVTNPQAAQVRTTRLYLRMTANERIQHALLASSFLLLVFTGFMLKFPQSWWVVALQRIVGDNLVDLRGLVHRIAAVIMTVTAVYHIYYIGFTQRGHRFVRDIMFKISDLSEMKQMLLYNLGLVSEKPRFDRFNYIEKSEYWALIWGTIIMTITGIILWFDNSFMATFSKLFIDVSQTIHYYEAWLAFLAIVVWHFYYVIFNPDAYPMNLTWLTGKITSEQMQNEHPRELERLSMQDNHEKTED